MVKIDEEIITAFSKSLKEESDRAKVIITVARIEYLFRLKLKKFYSYGSNKAHEKLFSANGPFATFSSKVNVAYCSGWIDSDVYHDIEILRKIRNIFAHRFENLTMNSPDIKKHIERFQVPHREFYDWGKLRAVETKNGIILYSGDKPKEAGTPLEVGNLTFNFAASIIFAVLLDNMGFQVELADGEIRNIELPEHMKK